MASGSLTGNITFESPRSLGCTMPANTYPNGSITFSNVKEGGAFWIQARDAAPDTVYIWTLYVCNSSGNHAHSIGTLSVKGTSGWYSNAVFTNSFSVSGATDLAGEALYLKVSCDRGTSGAQLEFRGSSSISIGTAVNQVYLTVSSADTNKGTVSGTGYHTPGVATGISASPKTGYHFTEWSCTSGSGSFANKYSASTSFTSSVNSTVVGSFAINSYTISVVAGNGGTITSGGGTWNYNSSNTISASASTGYKFKNWTISGAGSVTSSTSASTSFKVELGDATVTANFEKIAYTVSKASNPAAGGTVTLGKTTAYMNDVVTVGATPATGYQLSSWSTNVSGTTVSNNKFTMPPSNITITGNFTKKTYTITCVASPTAGGTPTASKSTANYGDSITLSNNRATGYLFDGWSSSDATITNNAFTMPAKNVTVTGRYHIGRSTASVDRTSVTPGDTLTLTINAEKSSFYHKYKLSFGLGMETELTTLSAGVTTADIYIPLAWSRMMKSTQKTGGTLTVYTYESDNSLLGQYVIDSLSYNALNGIIPKLTIRRADDVETLNIKGEKARYTIAVPSGVDYTLTCDNVSVDNPPKTGLLMPENTMTFATNTSVPVELEIEYGDETFTLTESVPSIWLLSKSVG